jgi:NAD(P)-dependent dehydrogenase (short-subunit alcohol dehydrogenase family)
VTSSVPWTPAAVPDLTGRRALVTGATGGLGEAVVEHLARHGAEVVLAARDERKLAATLGRLARDVPGAVLGPLVLDLADLSAVRRAAAEAASYGPLHLLLNNAGVMATPYARTRDGFELQLATNVLGHFALTGLLLPQLVAGGRDTEPARVVAVSSQGHRMARTAPLGDLRAQAGGYRRWPVYAQTKLANLLLTFELDRRARAAGLPVLGLAAHPGLAATGLMASGQRLHPGGTILDAAFSLLGQPPALGALPLLMAATADLPGGTYVGPGGPGEVRGMPRVVGTSALARDPDTARRMWEVAEEATGVHYP